MRSLVALMLVAAATASQAAQAPPRWPSFRGPLAAGVADGENIPDAWDVQTGDNIAWKVRVPGLGHSSPVIWDHRVFVTTAISSRADASFRPGLYGDGDASDDRSVHRWTISAYDLGSGDLLWERTAAEGVPVDKRHVKSTYASSTPATDGRVVVALFGSQGLYAWSLDGEPLWRVDLGRLDTGAYDLPEYEWGNASSPILWKGAVIVQCDTSGADFLAAFDAVTGEPLWRTARQEMPSWATPNVYEGEGGPELVTNAPNFIRGYDPRTGEELWRLGGSSNITAPTPVFTDDLLVIASGRRPTRPIFALRPGARGDITLPEGETRSDDVAWSSTGDGPYMPTPLLYRGHMYVLANQGILDCYDVATGERLYRTRVPHLGSGFSASPVASDGRIFLSNEDGEIVVVKAGPQFEHVATNSMGELLMATPAIGGGRMIVRAVSTLFAIGKDAGDRP